MREQRAQLDAINRSQGVVEFDLNGNILGANPIFLTAMGYQKAEVLGRHHSIFVDEDYRQSEEYRAFWQGLIEGVHDSAKYLRFGKNRKKVWIQATYTPILDLDNNPIKIIKFAQDITAFEASQTDLVTQLLNRERLIADVEQASHNNLAILDLLHYHYVSDFFGLALADRFLRDFTDLLRGFVAAGCETYRLSGGFFAVLNRDMSQQQFTAAMRELVAFLKRKSISIGVQELYIAVTCSVSFEPNATLLSSAEMTRRYAREKSKDFMVYNTALGIEKQFENNLVWAGKISQALREDRFTVHFQPIYNNHTRSVEKYECLVRMLDVDGSVISPFHFLDFAKMSKQYLDITRVVIAKSFAFFAERQEEFSINISIEDIVDEQLVEYFFTQLRRYPVAQRLVLEIVESEQITSYEVVYEFIERAKQLGCKIAIDDFGSGYSNFDYMTKINADYVKIDGSIVGQILVNNSSLTIMQSIMGFSQALGIKTIAEFIVDEQLQAAVCELGVDYSQGYFIGKPEPTVE